MLIGLAGRHGCGKSTVANILVSEYGFQKASFAAALKEYVASIFQWELEDLFSQTGKEALLSKPVVWDSETCRKLSVLSNLNIRFKGEKILHSRREALQFIGTDVLRDADQLFHINEFKKRFCNGDRFVCDDVRFHNELQMLKDIGAICIFIIRPYFWKYSNHLSEITLTRHHFDNVFVNDSSKHKLERKIRMFFDTSFSKKPPAVSKKEIVELLRNNNYNTNLCAEKLNCSRDKIVWWATKHMIRISRNKYSLNEESFAKPTKESAYWAGLLSSDGTIKKHLKHDFLLEFPNNDRELVEGFKKFLGTEKPISAIKREGKKTKYSITVSSPYLIEDLKLWNLEPKKSRVNKIPDCLKGNDELMSYWLVGLIDGDGSIYKTYNGKNVSITILASKEIIDYVGDWLKIPSSVSQEKDIDNLYNRKFSGKYSVALYNRIYRGIGLPRKWNRVVPFLHKKWHH